MEEKLIFVEWEDTAFKDKWCGKNEIEDFIEENCFVKTIGWIIQDSKTHIILSNCFEGESFNGIWKIPKKCVRKIIEVKTKI